MAEKHVPSILVPTSAEDLERETLEAVRAAAESQAILDALKEAGHNVSAAADRLGITRSTMYRRMRKYGLRAART